METFGRYLTGSFHRDAAARSFQAGVITAVVITEVSGAGLEMRHGTMGR